MNRLGSGLLLSLVLVSGCRTEPAAQNQAPEPAAVQGSSADQAAVPPPVETTEPTSQGSQTSEAKAGACDVQAGSTLPNLRLRAVGTEPFWGARIEGRCVTYSHPDDQAGTRVWTKFEGSASAGSWTGSLGGKPFVLRTQPEAGCSDGMSDRRYPMKVALTVGGEERQGCAEPL